MNTNFVNSFYFIHHLFSTLMRYVCSEFNHFRSRNWAQDSLFFSKNNLPVDAAQPADMGHIASPASTSWDGYQSAAVRDETMSCSQTVFIWPTLHPDMILHRKSYTLNQQNASQCITSSTQLNLNGITHRARFGHIFLAGQKSSFTAGRVQSHLVAQRSLLNVY